MKKTILIIVCIAAVIAAFVAGMTVSAVSNKKDIQGSNVSSSDKKNTEDKKESDKSADDAEEEKTVQKTPKNVFFSPNTGSDLNGNATQWSPVKTLKKAKELAKDIKVGENEELLFLEYMMTVDVKTQNAAGVFSDAGGVNMIPFTGRTDGYYFKGDIVGQGCDTQKYLPNDGGVLFSARYLLKGRDYKGQDCSIFIENNGTALDLCTPTIITDSRALADWQSYEMRAIVVPVDGGVSVNVYRIHRD